MKSLIQKLSKSSKEWSFKTNEYTMSNENNYMKTNALKSDNLENIQ